MNEMAEIATDKPHPKPTLNQPNMEWSSLRTLHEGSGGRNEAVLLMAPKLVIPWAQTLLHRGEQFKIVELAIGRFLHVLVLDGVLVLGWVSMYVAHPPYSKVAERISPGARGP